MADGKKYIALTFDDGPDEVITPKVLDILDRYGAKGTFFLIGNNISESTAHLVRREHESGHEIANHSRTHSDMTKFTREQTEEEISATDSRIRAVTGQGTRFFRPPYIAYNELMFDTIDKAFICGIGCDDWDSSVSVDKRVETVLGAAEDGVIILLHDQQNNHKTVEALERIVPGLIGRGFELVTLSELFARHGKEPRSDLPIIYSDVFKTELY